MSADHTKTQQAEQVQRPNLLERYRPLGLKAVVAATTPKRPEAPKARRPLEEDLLRSA
ncbi:hypothetical protein [Xaviernesmea oryzae]|uniref:hypothetical protein n=1 Tax=Xaviernesmea oryzae TaxID=464029 RepID=UPI0008C17697|nr:hypothetical protein [Xaviernesmea oryzae]SEK62701.1 hypothetical protein SAMN04487976_103130 [Xaviernesmea oryzae]